MSTTIRPVNRSVLSNQNIFIALCLLPAVLFLGIFLYYPIVETIRLSFMKSTGLGGDTFIGIKNYTYLFKDPEFQAGLVNVFGWAFWSIVIQIPLAFFIAFSLTFYVNKMTKPLRIIYYLANVLPSAITAMLGKFIFAPTNGILNNLGIAFGWKWLSDLDFLGSQNLAFWSVFAVATWTYTGFPIIYLMARIEQISKDIKEAAELDGVTGWKYAFYIVLPNLKYPMRILAVLCTTGSLKLMDLPYMMTSGGPGNATVTLGITLYRHGFINWQYGKAAAVGVVILVLSLMFTIVQFSWQNKEGDTV
jgi:ABC-type sugar transport system permease subunit